MREPDMTGPLGRAWKSAEPSEEVLAKNPAWRMCNALYLVHRPGAHPLWNWYVVSGSSLAEIPGQPPAHHMRPGTTHEVMILALDPQWVPDDGWDSEGDGRWGKHFLKPSNLVTQLDEFTDEQNTELVFVLTRAICYGHINPDEDFRAANAVAVATTADHIRKGLHSPS